jgi:hypothetical protein
MKIKPTLLKEQVEAWQKVILPVERAEAIAGDTNAFNEAALDLAVDMPFDSEASTFARELDRLAED